MFDKKRTDIILAPWNMP